MCDIYSVYARIRTTREIEMSEKPSAERAARTAAHERSAQSEREPSWSVRNERHHHRHSHSYDSTNDPDRLVFPIYRKYLIPNKPGQAMPCQTKKT